MSFRNLTESKKVLSLFMAFLMLFSVFSVAIPTGTAYAEEVTETGKYVVVASSLTIRSTPSTTGTSLGAVWQGVVVDVTEISAGFGKITHGNTTGWVSMEYLMKYDSAVYGTYQVTATSLNIRSEKVNGTVVASVGQNEYLTGVVKDGSWTYVLYNGKRGWASNTYLRKIDGTEAEIKNVVIVGAIVRIKRGSAWMESTEEFGNSTVISQWVFEKDLTVYSINGERVVVGDGEGNIIGVININDLIIVSGGKSEINLDVDTSKGKYSRVTDVSQIVNGSYIILYDSVNQNILLPEADTTNMRINPLKDVTAINYTDTQYAWQVEVSSGKTYLKASNGQYLYAKNSSKETYYDSVKHTTGDENGQFTFDIPTFFISVATTQPSFIYYYAPGDYYRFYKSKESDNVETPGLTVYIYGEKGSGGGTGGDGEIDSNIKVGSIVGIKEGAKDFYGESLTAGDYAYKQYKVIGIKGNRVVLEKADGIVFDHPMNIKDLYLITASSDTDTDSSQESDIDTDVDPEVGYPPDSSSGAYIPLNSLDGLQTGSYVLMYDLQARQLLLPTSEPETTNTIQGAKTKTVNFKTTKYAWKVERNSNKFYLKTSDDKYLYAMNSANGAYYSSNYADVSTVLNCGNMTLDYENNKLIANTSTKRYLNYVTSGGYYRFYQSTSSAVEDHEIYFFVYDPSKGDPDAEDVLDNGSTSTDTDSVTDTDSSKDTDSTTDTDNENNGTIIVGSIVGVKDGANFYDGTKPSSWVYDAEFTVYSIKGERVVVSRNGTIIGAFNIKDLYLISGGGASTDTDNTLDTDVETSFKVGDVVRIYDGKNWYDGTKPSSWVYTTDFVIYSIKGDRVVLTRNGSVIGAININDIYLVTSTTDNVPPTLTDAKVINVTNTAYTVTVNATDNVGISKVVFKTYFEADGAGTAKEANGSYSGTTATYTVNMSDFGNKAGKYITVITAYDKENNASASLTVSQSLDGVANDNENPVIKDIKISDVTGTSYKVTCTVTDDSGISKVTFYTWATENGEKSAIYHSGTVNGTTATCVIKSSLHNSVAGEYNTKVIATDVSGKKTESQVVKTTLTGSSSGSEYTPGASGTGAVLANGIDVSKWQGNIDWNKVKAAGVDYAIIRCGYSGTIDPYFEENYRKAKEAGIDVGVYIYTYSTTVEGAESDAADCLKWINGKTLEYPVYFDIEDPLQKALSSTVCTEMVAAFANKISEAGYLPGVYASTSFISTNLNFDALKNSLEFWVARYYDYTSNDRWNYSKTYGAWQYSDKGTVSGISGNVDLDVCYKDYPTIVKNHGLNGYNGTNIEPTGISLNKGDTTINVGEVVQLTATIEPSNATNKNVAWTTSDDSVVSVTSTGIIKGLKIGKATITAKTSNNIEVSIEITVKDEVEVFEIDKTVLSLGVGETATIKVNKGNSTESVSWTSSNTGVATVSAGTVTAVKKGTAIITATCGDKKALCRVTVSETDSISISETALIMIKGETKLLTATTDPEDAVVAWSTTDESIVKVSAYGMLLAVGNGTAMVTASSGGKSASCRVEVRTELTGITLDKTTLSMDAGDIETLTVIGQPDGATVTKVSWSSSNTAVATVSAGKVTAISNGKTVITATCGNFKATCEVEVISSINSVTLNEKEIYMTVDSVYELKATTDPAGKNISWSSSDPKVAVVLTNGYVTAVSKGTAVITATCGGKKATCTVYVGQEIESIKMSTKTLQLGVGRSSTLLVIISPSSLYDQKVKWSSSDESIVKVDQNGRVTGVAKGVAIVTADCFGKSAQCEVTVGVPVTSIVPESEMLSIYVNETATIKATVSPSDATNKTLTFKSENTKIATVDNNGVVKGINPGTTNVTITCGSITVSVRIVVSYPVESIALSNEKLSLSLGDTAKLTVNVTPSEAKDNVMIWSSSDKNIVTVENGLVKAVGIGTAVVTVSCADKSARCVVTVTAEIDALAVDKQSLSLVPGETEKVELLVSPANIPVTDAAWKSENPSVATVDEKGNVTAVAKGKTNVIVSLGGKSIKIPVYVGDAVQSITLDKNQLNMSINGTEQLTAVVVPSAEGQIVAWSSSNRKVAVVDANGKVTAVGNGEATIIAKCGGKTAECNVIVSTGLNKIEFDITSKTIGVGQSFKINVLLSPSNTNVTVFDLKWKSNDATVATVNNGTVTGVGVGEATITATYGNVSATCVITVKNILAINDKSDLVIDRDGSKIYNVQEGTTKAELEKHFVTSIVVVDANNNEVADDSARICTGYKVQLIVDGKVADELLLIVMGDVNGDGYVNMKDVVMTQMKVASIDTSITMMTFYSDAADINFDGSTNMKDIVLIQQYIVGIYKNLFFLSYYQK